MKQNLIQTEVDVKGNTIKVLRIDGYEYISLTDLAKTYIIGCVIKRHFHF